MIMDRHMKTPIKNTGTLYSQFAPSPQLAPYVACYWTITREHGEAADKIRVLPDGCMDAIFDLSGGLAPLGVARAANPRPTAFITGVSSTPEVIALPKSPLIAGIRFKPGGAVPFLDIPASEIAEKSVDLDSVLPNFSQLAISLTGDAETPGEMAQIMDRLLLERLHLLPDTDNMTAFAVSAMTRNNNYQRVDALVQDMGISQKKLERAVKHHAGMTPKRLGRTTRFVSAIRSLHAAPCRPLADLALDLGFTDQAHFNRDFKSMAGLTPTRWLAERQDVDFLQYTPFNLA